MSSNLIRALTIGFSILVIIFTISGIIAYYNAARMQAEKLNYRTEFSKEVLPDIVENQEFTTGKIRGMDVINLIRKYNNDLKVEINLNIIGSYENNVNSIATWKNTYNNIADSKLSLIDGVKEYNVQRSVSQNKVIVSISE